MLIFKCPKCEDSLMGFNEAEDVWVCSEGDCQHEIEANEAEELFESGDLIGLIEDSEYEDDLNEEDDDDDDSDDEDDSDDDDDDDDSDDDDSKDESFNGYSNQETWTANLVIQNEYKVNKGAIAAIREADEDNVEKALRLFVEKIAKSDDYSEIFEDIDFDDIDWSELVESINDSISEFEAIRNDLEEALSVNEDVSEEERTKIATVFESALMVKYNELKTSLEEKMNVEIDEANEENYKALTQEMSGYLDEVVSEWMQNNEIALENAIQTRMTKNFMDGLMNLFAEHYIEVPEGRFDVLEDMATKIEQMDEELSTAKAETAALQEKLDEASKETVIRKLSDGLTDTQVEKLEELAGSVDYESETQFEEALGTLKESFLKPSKNRKDGDTIVVETTDSNNHDDDNNVDPNDPIALAAAGLNRKN